MSVINDTHNGSQIIQLIAEKIPRLIDTHSPFTFTELSFL